MYERCKVRIFDSTSCTLLIIPEEFKDTLVVQDEGTKVLGDLEVATSLLRQNP